MKNAAQPLADREPTPTPRKNLSVGVFGAGAMGSGIAQIAAHFGHTVVLYDTHGSAVARARNNIEKALAREIEKGKLFPENATKIMERIVFVQGEEAEGMASMNSCGLIVEAIIEDAALKRDLFAKIENFISKDCILATNTSSLSVASVGSLCKHPGRVVGVHFFNPAPVMPLVEIIPALTTDLSIVETAREIVASWGKTTVLAKDTPGFIVNRIARPFYGESIRILEEGIAEVATIDWAMKELGGFRMGPFELMDFIGNDVNFKVSESVFEAFFYDPRYKPSVTQQRLVEARLLGRKTHRGYYDYREGAKPPEPKKENKIGQEIFMRVLSMLINEAVDAVFLKVATPEDIDLAMTKGVNYPKGLLHWADEIGLEKILKRLSAMHDEYGEDRYRPSPLMKRMVKDGKTFFE